MRNRQKKATIYAGALTVAILGAVVVGTVAMAVPPTKAPPAPVPGLTDLGILENRFFSHPYAHDPVDKRLERLECMVFGGIQAGTPEDRLSKLIKVVAQRSQAPIREEKAAVTENQEEASPSKSAPSTPSAGKSSAQYPVLNTLEWRALKKTYATESLDQRLDRLESKTFGQPAQGMAYADRVDRLRRTLGIGIDTGVGNNPLTAGGVGPAPRARAGGDGTGSPFGYRGAPSDVFPGGGFSFGFPGGMDMLFDATFDKQFGGMMQQMNKQMEEAMRLGPGSWRFDPKTNTWVDLDTGRKKSAIGDDAPRFAPGPRSHSLPPSVAPQRRPNVIEDVPPYADPNSI